MIDVGPTDLIAVANRSHNIFKLFSGSEAVSFSFKLASGGQRLG